MTVTRNLPFAMVALILCMSAPVALAQAGRASVDQAHPRRIQEPAGVHRIGAALLRALPIVSR